MQMPSRTLRGARSATGVALLILGTLLSRLASATEHPGILLILSDNLGYGEIGVYGGGETRGAPTPRLDALAAEGLRLTNMNTEPQCTPSRSSIMTGRFAIRSGTHSVPSGGGADGLVPWEITLGEVLSAAGYTTGYFGKWHLGSHDGRLPNDQGFDTWFGVPRSTDEAVWPTSPGYDPKIAPPSQIMEGRRGERSRGVRVYDLVQRRLIDAEITRRTVAFIREAAQTHQLFFAVAALTQPHMPALPHPDFSGRSGSGDWADMLTEMDYRVGEMLDALREAQVENDTLVIFASDNGAEFNRPWDGWSGPWRGAYFTALEGGIRVPFFVRWPGRVPAGRVSNEIMHGVDLLPTLATIAGGTMPGDRPIDGLDQSAFLLGRQTHSAREGFPIWVADRLQAVKWRNYKMHFYRQDTMFDPPQKLGSPMLLNLYTDPREEKPVWDSWVGYPIKQMVGKFSATLLRNPPIPPGAPDTWTP